MNNTTTKAVLIIAAGLLAVSSMIAPGARAQMPGSAGQFSFGPPLRNGILFIYKYTERSKIRLFDKNGTLQDSSERVLTYFISQRQTEAQVGGGAIIIEANIDSMRLDYRGAGGDVTFDTQLLDDVNDATRVSHRAVLVPSTLVSSVARFTISPYGKLVGMESQAFANLLEQAQDPMLDDFTYKRVEQMINDEYLSTVFLPWRNAVPFGHTVEFGREIRIPFVGTLDRIVFADSVDVVLKRGDDDPDKPTLHFKAELSEPRTEWVTYEGLDDPVLLKDAEGIVTGMFNLDKDGVVLSGLSVANGTAAGSVRGREIIARYEHHTYVELMDMKASPVN